MCICGVWVVLCVYMYRCIGIPMYDVSCLRLIYRELRGSQEMGVISNNRFDRVLLSSLHVQALVLTDVQSPLGPL